MSAKITLKRLGVSLGFAKTTERFDAAVPDHLNQSSVKRQLDFLAGRKAAQRAIERLSPLICSPVGVNAQGLPIWPDGITGSISHSDGIAVAAVAYRKSVLSLGIDIELRSRTNIIKDISHLILSPVEKEQTSCPFRLLTRFSAKESVYKCLFPLLHQFIDYSQCSIKIADDNCFTIKLNKEISCPSSLKVRGIFTTDENYLMTICWITTATDK